MARSAYEPDSPRRIGWEGAVCASDPHPDDWLAVSPTRLDGGNLRALDLCQSCPALGACLAWHQRTPPGQPTIAGGRLWGMSAPMMSRPLMLRTCPECRGTFAAATRRDFCTARCARGRRSGP